MSSQQQARLLMEALAVLHQQGYGLIKLSCYVKDGIGAWRHCIFASEDPGGHPNCPTYGHPNCSTWPG